MYIVYKKSIKLSSVPTTELKNTPGALESGLKRNIIAKYSTQTKPFREVEIRWTQQQLDQHTCGPNLISANIYQGGHRHGSNWQSTQVLVFDFDNKEAGQVTSDKDIFHTLSNDPFWTKRNPSFYLHYSRGHNPEEGLCKFHLFFLLDREVVDHAEHQLIYDYLMSKHFTTCDDCDDLARCFFPGRGDVPSYFKEGKPLEVDELLKLAHRERLQKQSEDLHAVLHAVTKKNNKPGAEARPVFLPLDTLVEFEDGSVKRLRDLSPEDKERFICPHCGQRPGRGNPGKANATYQLNSKGLPIVFCSSCKAEHLGGTALMGVYNIVQEETYEVVRDRLREKYHNYFYLEDKLARVKIQTDVEPYSVSISKVHPRAINEPRILKDALLAELAEEARSISELVFNREGDLDIDIPSYQWKGDVLIGKIPALRSQKEDNAFIEDWLKQLYGKYKDFIKQWLAMYCYTNYVPLPVLVLYSKERGTGKNVFAEAICGIFDRLHSRDTDYKQFTEAFKCKLWYIDEQCTDGKELYKVVKQIGGNNQLQVNIKYGLKHQVDRNLNVILTTNELKPMHMEADELQLDETNNQFFVLEMKPILKKDRKADIADLIQERLGHYVRTELRDVYQQIQQDPERGSYRYGIPVPVTREEERLYCLSRTAIERDALEVWDCIAAGKYQHWKRGDIDLLKTEKLEYRCKDKVLHIMPALLRNMVKRMELESSYNKIRDHLQQKGLMGLDVVKDSNQRYGYWLRLGAGDLKTIISVSKCVVQDLP